jgi:hypothetical protein
MKLTKPLFVIGVFLLISGFFLSFFLGDRSTGKVIVLLGFVAMVVGIIIYALVIDLSVGIKIGVLGFSLIFAGQIMHIVLDQSFNGLSNFLFWIGGIVMLAGIIVHGLKIISMMTKRR